MRTKASQAQNVRLFCIIERLELAASTRPQNTLWNIIDILYVRLNTREEREGKERKEAKKRHEET